MTPRPAARHQGQIAPQIVAILEREPDGLQTAAIAARIGAAPGSVDNVLKRRTEIFEPVPAEKPAAKCRPRRWRLKIPTTWECDFCGAINPRTAATCEPCAAIRPDDNDPDDPQHPEPLNPEPQPL